MTTLPAVVRVIDLPIATTITLGEVLEAVQTVGGVQISVQVPLSQVMTSALGGLPTGGGTSQILAKASGTNFSAAWYDVTSFVSINTTSLATTGSGTALVIGVKTSGIGSSQLGALAVQSSNVTTNAIGNTQFRQGTGLSVVGVAANATANVADIVATVPLQVLQLNAAGNGLAFTALVQGSAFLGITNTGLFSQSGTVLATGTFGVVGTTLLTGTFGAVGTANFTANAFNVVGTASFTSGVFSVNGTTLFTSARFGLVGTSLVTGVFGVVGTTLFTSGAFGVVGTTQFTGTFGIAGTTLLTGTLGLSSLTAGVLVASSTGVISNQGGMVLLNTLSPNGVASTNDTSSFTSAYRNYMFTLENVNPANNSTFLRMQLATSASSWVIAAYNAVINVPGLGLETDATSFLITGKTATTSVGTTAGQLDGIFGTFYLYGPSGAAHKGIAGSVSYLTAAGSFNSVSPGGNSGLGGAVTGVNFFFNSGNIATGLIKIYGIT